MKKLQLLFLLLLPIWLAGQTDAARQIDSLVDLSKTLMNQGKSRFTDALKAIEEAEILARKDFGELSAAYVKCRFQHGRLLDASGKMDEAEPYYQEVKAIQEKTIGKENAAYATTVYHLASVTKDLGYYPEAESLYLEALRIQEKTPGKEHPDYVAALYSVPNRGIIVVEKPKKSLYELIWKPLMPALTNINTVYFASAGLLHRINLGAVPINIDSVVADRYKLIGLGSTRQVASTSAFENTNNRVALFGAIQFDMDTLAIQEANKLLPTDMASRGLEGTQTSSPGAQTGPFQFIKGSVKEVNLLADILTEAGFNPEKRTGFAATEEAVKSLGTREEAPRILHLATHGYFFPDPKDSILLNIPANENTTGFIASSHPLIRSGLAMAGANYAWSTGKPFKKGMENGILTAYEISHLDLQNTELVVLSACETGLGDIEGNEGVYGLRRAFKIAGAKYLVMSLWKVPDFQTQELMTAYYSHWLLEKQTIPDAFRAAQLEMRERYENPYFWAGFVLME